MNQPIRIKGVWELTGSAAQLVIDIQSEAVQKGKAKPGKQRVIQRLLCEAYNEKNKCKGDC
jgi:hypothetical protein